MTISPYPLQWPDGRPRTPAVRRRPSPFRTKFDAARQNVITSLRGFQKDAGARIEHPVISSNVTLLDNKPSDPGACVWFMMEGSWVALGVDRFPSVEANIQAIHHIIEARRVELRYGGMELVRQTFKGFLALPAPQRRPWRAVMNFSDTQLIGVEEVEARFRELARDRHPDKPGGSVDAMTELNAARDEALKEVLRG